MRLYLIRHAESANNAVYDGTAHPQGRTPDPDITDIGHQQSQRLADFLAHNDSEPRQHPFAVDTGNAFGLTHLYCSLMARSVLTAQYISDACALQLQALPDVFEQGGLYDVDQSGRPVGVPGPNRDELARRFPGVLLPSSLNETGWWNRPRETEREFVLRTGQALADLRERHAGSDDRVGLVVHGDFIDQCINELMGITRWKHNYRQHWISNWPTHNTSVSRVDFLAGSCNVIYTNRIDHLLPELVTW